MPDSAPPKRALPAPAQKDIIQKIHGTFDRRLLS
nr:MAG TPA: hypothetical protein [Microviridae sp.]